MSSLLLLEYDEDQWFRYSDEQKQECYDAWVKKYLPVTEYHGIVLKLKPDPIFPRDPEVQYPYVAWQYDLSADRKPAKGYEVLLADVIIGLATKDFDVPLRRAVEMELLKYPNGTTYKVSNSEGRVLLQGKVNK